MGVFFNCDVYMWLVGVICLLCPSRSAGSGRLSGPVIGSVIAYLGRVNVQRVLLIHKKPGCENLNLSPKPACRRGRVDAILV